MAQYIDKSALVAEIDRLKERFITFHHRDGIDWPLDNYGKMRAYNEVLSFLDTLEVKEVDLEKEIDRFYGMYRKDGKTFLLEDNEECLDWKVDCNPDFEIGFAKHFFELGLKARKGVEV